MGAALLVGTSICSASTFTYDFSDRFNGASPTGTPPWLQASFTDTGLPANTVQLTLSAVNLLPNESVSCWYFNLNPTLNPTSLSFGSPSDVGAFNSPSVQTGTDAFKAAGSGKYDVLFTFAGSGDASTVFGSGDSVTYTITGIGLSAADFSFLSTPGGGAGPYASAAHIVSDGQSGWVDPSTVLHASAVIPDFAVPDASTTLMLLSVSVVAVAAFGWRREVGI